MNPLYLSKESVMERQTGLCSPRSSFRKPYLVLPSHINFASSSLPIIIMIIMLETNKKMIVKFNLGPVQADDDKGLFTHYASLIFFAFSLFLLGKLLNQAPLSVVNLLGIIWS